MCSMLVLIEDSETRRNFMDIFAYCFMCILCSAGKYTVMAVNLTSTCADVIAWLKANGCSEAVCNIFEGLQGYADTSTDSGLRV